LVTLCQGLENKKLEAAEPTLFRSTLLKEAVKSSPTLMVATADDVFTSRLTARRVETVVSVLMENCRAGMQWERTD